MLRLTSGLLPAVLLIIAGCAATEKATTQVKAVAQAAVAAPSLTPQDAAFMDQAGRGGIEEVTFGQLARTQSGRAAVRDYGLRMVDDHTKLNQQLTRLANRKQITPTTSMDTAHQNAFVAMQQLHGRPFDQAYLDQQVTDHETMLTLFRDEATHGTDADVKAFAAAAVPQLAAHLRLAERLGGHATPPPS